MGAAYSDGATLFAYAVWSKILRLSTVFLFEVQQNLNDNSLAKHNHSNFKKGKHKNKNTA